jgi:uroporphyrinogen-III synthase
MSRRPLEAVGVIVTRPAREAAPLAQKLAAMGARSIVFPAIVILPAHDRGALDAVLARLADYDGVFFVSPSAVEHGAPPAAAWPAGLPAYAPGPGTAAALAAAGIATVRYPAHRHDSEGLLALPQLANVRGKRFAILRGDGGRELIADTLRARGATVDLVACYRRMAPRESATDLDGALRRGEAQALTLTSSEAARNLWQAIDAASHAALCALPSFVTHPRIADTARALGLDVHLTGSGDAGLIAALLDWFNPSPKGMR